MSENSISVRNLSKAYRLGLIGATSLREEMTSWYQRRIRKTPPPTESSKLFWALKDVSFDVPKGEIIGIIGHNGSGKSTLLKLLGRITEPTSGEAFVNGRIASLLEVGTGFHPELTGRENIFLNGTILGMKRREIESKFDEIVEFAGIAKFIHTPVKRYSSGMYVRLAFAVAAHLEPEILLVDEVLAVGDQAFQTKCLQKMNDISRQRNRTILFVSHNMSAISRLCHRTLHLDRGKMVGFGPTNRIIEEYLEKGSSATGSWAAPDGANRNSVVQFLRADIMDTNHNPKAFIGYTEPFIVQITFAENATTTTWLIRISVHDAQGNEILSSFDTESEPPRIFSPHQTLIARCEFPGAILRPGLYRISASACETAGEKPVKLYEEIQELAKFEVTPQGFNGRSDRGLIAPPAKWSYEASTTLLTVPTSSDPKS